MKKIFFVIGEKMEIEEESNLKILSFLVHKPDQEIISCWSLQRNEIGMRGASIY